MSDEICARSMVEGGRLRIDGMAVEFPRVAGHPNRVPFEGVLTLVDRPSDRAPSGARGHRVVLTREAAEAALPTLLGMAVDFKAGWDGHDARQKCGIVTAAAVDAGELRVEGYLFAHDFAEMMREVEAHGDEALGMSYELADAHVEDMRASVWRLTKATFTGAAILLREKAAYGETSFRVMRCESSRGRLAARTCGSGRRRGPARSKERPALRTPQERLAFAQRAV